ncbi:MAG TPA: hypothetical protein VIU64_04270 [Polyangia bacterium]
MNAPRRARLGRLSWIAGCGLATLATLAGAGVARASCRISNETGYSFTVSSGNTSNQSVGAHTTTTIAPGTIVGKSKEGKTFGGSCKDGDNLILKEDKGVPILMPK